MTPMRRVRLASETGLGPLPTESNVRTSLGKRWIFHNDKMTMKATTDWDRGWRGIVLFLSLLSLGLYTACQEAFSAAVGIP